MKLKVFLTLIILTQVIFAQTWPDSRHPDWSEAGLIEARPTVADNFINIQTDPNLSGTTTNKLKSAITRAGTLTGTTIIYFPDGTYNIDEQNQYHYR